MKYTIFFLFLLAINANISAQTSVKKIIEQNKFYNYTDGSEKSITDIIKENKGKVIYIDFWASWCGPCRQLMPASIQLHQKLKGKDIVFVYISLDANRKAWKRSMEKLKIQNIGLHYQRDRDEMIEFLKFFYIYSIPHYMIIGKNGQIVNRDAAAPNDPLLERRIRKLLKAKS